MRIREGDFHAILKDSVIAAVRVGLISYQKHGHELRGPLAHFQLGGQPFGRRAVRLFRSLPLEAQIDHLVALATGFQSFITPEIYRSAVITLSFYRIPLYAIAQQQFKHWFDHSLKSDFRSPLSLSLEEKVCVIDATVFASVLGLVAVLKNGEIVLRWPTNPTRNTWTLPPFYVALTDYSYPVSFDMLEYRYWSPFDFVQAPDVRFLRLPTIIAINACPVVLNDGAYVLLTDFEEKAKVFAEWLKTSEKQQTFEEVWYGLS